MANLKSIKKKKEEENKLTIASIDKLQNLKGSGKTIKVSPGMKSKLEELGITAADLLKIKA